MGRAVQGVEAHTLWLKEESPHESRTSVSDSFPSGPVGVLANMLVRLSRGHLLRQPGAGGTRCPGSNPLLVAYALAFGTFPALSSDAPDARSFLQLTR